MAANILYYVIFLSNGDTILESYSLIVFHIEILRAVCRKMAKNKYDWKDYIAILIALLQILLLPNIIIIIILIVIAIVLTMI